MRFSIGLRLFAAVLLAILAVAASGIALMRQNVLHSFSEYAANIELDRLDELSRELGRQYQSQAGWRFLPEDDAARRDWIGSELARLQSEREAREAGELPQQPPAAPAAPVAPAPAAPPVRFHTHGPAAAPSVQPHIRRPAEATAAAAPAAEAAMLAPSPPPPLPPPPVPPVPPAPGVTADVDELGLQQRVTLFDAQGRYLAGRPPGTDARSQRPVLAGGRTVGYLAVARVMRPSDALAAAFLGQIGSSLWAIAAASVALSALAAVLLAAHFRKPIGRLAGGARALSDGRFDTRLDARRSDELGDLARSFNALAERLDSAEQARRQWVADTSHELRTPLSVLRAQLEAIQDGVRQPDGASVAAMLRQVLSLNALIDQLYALARADVGALDLQRQPLDLWKLARECAAGFADRLHGAGLALDIGAPPARAIVLADAERMRQVFANLLENSARYTAHGGRVALNASAHGGELAISIDDSAPGVPADALPRLAERFYRVDASRARARGGAGLGLALCRRMVEAHGAHLAFSHSPLGGLRATITFSMEKP